MSGRSGSLEIWRRLLLDYRDFHNCFLAAGIRALLILHSAYQSNEGLNVSTTAR
jgi:hypothetical protein